MKTVSPAFAAHLAQEVTTLATCWKLTRRDGVVMGFTDHDQDLLLDEVTFKAATGFTPSAIHNTANLSVDNLDVEGMLTAGSITESDILAGKYDFAEIAIFHVNYRDPAAGRMDMRQGWLGEVALGRKAFVAEVRGLTQRLTYTIGELYSASCRAVLGDGRCKVDMAAHTVSGAVGIAESLLQFTDASRGEDSGIFDHGKMVFTSGANAGIGMEVKHYQKMTVGGRFTLVLPLPYPVAPGDAFSVSKGCDKAIGTCHGRFGNVLNFRGEPLVPGLDRVLETAGTRSIG